MAKQIVIGIGEVLWDVFPRLRRPGGAPANVAFHANQMGECGVVCSRVGRDALGDELVAFLRDRGLIVSHIQRDARLPTGTVTVDATQAESPRYTIHENVAWDALALDEPLSQVAAQASAICFGTLAQRSGVSRETIRATLGQCGHALRVYDVNLRPPWYSAECVAASLDLCDVVKLSAEEAVEVARLCGLNAERPTEIARALIDRCGLRLVCITRGSDGAAVVSADECVESPAVPVHVVEAVGAGDSFAAAMIHGMLAEWPLERMLRFAIGVSGLVVGREGAMPPMHDEIAALEARI